MALRINVNLHDVLRWAILFSEDVRRSMLSDPVERKAKTSTRTQSKEPSLWRSCSLKSEGLEPECGVWETPCMADKEFAPVAGDLVISLHKRGVFKVLAMSHGGQTTAIQLFNISKQQLLGEPLEDIPCDTLLPFKEDASQAAARIAKEATEGH